MAALRTSARSISRAVKRADVTGPEFDVGGGLGRIIGAAVGHHDHVELAGACAGDQLP